MAANIPAFFVVSECALCSVGLSSFPERLLLRSLTAIE
jgi:hypothetical protein